MSRWTVLLIEQDLPKDRHVIFVQVQHVQAESQREAEEVARALFKDPAGWAFIACGRDG